MKDKKARVIALYLPQFHPIPENDTWWGKGFTEWTNVRNAKPLFKGHYQPKVPTDLGYYDLRNTEVREAQAELARNAGIEGFAYWHYWFGNGKELLERPFNEVLNSGKPDFPFCLAWANHSWYAKNWSKSNVKGKDKLLIEQLYPGIEDYRNHFFSILNALKDERYLKIDKKPIFYIYAPDAIPDVSSFISLWKNLAVENGLNGIYFIGQTRTNDDCNKIIEMGFDGVCRSGINNASNKVKNKFSIKLFWYLRQLTNSKLIPLNKYKYSKIIENLLDEKLDGVDNIFPTIIPNFDHSPRSAREGLIYDGSTPELFKKLIKMAINNVKCKKYDHRIVLLRSWNEWGEGNYVEPDSKYGHGYLKALKEEIND